MNVVFCRIDERLTHGQVVTSWAKNFSIKRILLIDDDIAKDDFAIQALTFSAPRGVEVVVRNVEDAYKMLHEDPFGGNVMVLFKQIRYVYELFKLGYAINEIDIGNIGSAPGRKSITKRIYISDEEKELLRSMISMGCYIYIQELPLDQKVNVISKI